jgi:hypothetical protein
LVLVSPNALNITQDERNPTDDLLLQFETIGQLPPQRTNHRQASVGQSDHQVPDRGWVSARTVVAPPKKITSKRSAPAGASR